MGSRRRVDAVTNDGKLVRLLGCSLRPIAQTVDFRQDSFGKRQCGTARRIDFSGMVRFGQRSMVSGLSVHLARQKAVEREKEIHPDAEVAGVKKRAIFLRADAFGFVETVEPARSTAHHGNPRAQAGDYMIKTRIGVRKVDGDLGAAEVSGRKVGGVFGGNFQDDIVSGFGGEAVEELSHFSVAKQGDVGHGSVFRQRNTDIRYTKRRIGEREVIFEPECHLWQFSCR